MERGRGVHVSVGRHQVPGDSRDVPRKPRRDQRLEHSLPRRASLPITGCPLGVWAGDRSLSGPC